MDGNVLERWQSPSLGMHVCVWIVYRCTKCPSGESNERQLVNAWYGKDDEADAAVGSLSVCRFTRHRPLKACRSRERPAAGVNSACVILVLN